MSKEQGLTPMLNKSNEEMTACSVVGAVIVPVVAAAGSDSDASSALSLALALVLAVVFRGRLRCGDDRISPEDEDKVRGTGNRVDAKADVKGRLLVLVLVLV
jgi:hypothetical protein